MAGTLRGAFMDKRGLVLVAAAICASGLWIWSRRSRPDVITYRGERITLSKAYRDFDEYKNDPDNIHPSETARVQRLLIEAPVAHSFSNRLDVFRATGDITFPGYGSGSGGGLQPDGSELLAIYTEIPRADTYRYLVFRGRGGHYELVDDFTQREIPPFGIREDSGSYVFHSRDGHEFFRRPAVRR